MRRLLIVRGLPGAGKSEFARDWINHRVVARDAGTPTVCEADDYFETSEGYQFDASQLTAAHQNCIDSVRDALVDEAQFIAVANTFSRRWEFQPYIQMAEEMGVKYYVVSLYDSGFNDRQLHARCVHNVPLTTISMMRERWEF